VLPAAAANAPFAGIGAVLRLSPGPQILDLPRAMMFANVGGMAAARAGGSRSAQWILLRNALEEAKRYRAVAHPSKPRDQLLNHLDAEALQPSSPAACHSGRRSSRVRYPPGSAAERRFQRSGRRLRCAEAWRVAGLLAAHRIPVVLDPFDDLPWTFDEIGSRLDNAALLQRAGVVIAFTLPPIHLSHNAGSALREAAGLAVANGLPWIER